MKKKFALLAFILGLSFCFSGCRFIVKKTDPANINQTEEIKPLTQELCLEKSIEEIKKIPHISELIKLYDQTIGSEFNPSNLIGYAFELSNEDEDSFTVSLTEDHEDHTLRIEHIQVKKSDGTMCLEDIVSAECLPQESDPVYLQAFTKECAQSFQ